MRTPASARSRWSRSNRVRFARVHWNSAGKKLPPDVEETRFYIEETRPDSEEIGRYSGEIARYVAAIDHYIAEIGRYCL